MTQNIKKGARAYYHLTLITGNSILYLSPEMQVVGEQSKYGLMQLDAFTTSFANQTEFLEAISKKLNKDVTHTHPLIHYNPPGKSGMKDAWLELVYDYLEILLPFIRIPYSGMVRDSFLFQRQVQEILSHCKNPDFLAFAKDSDYFSDYLSKLMEQYVRSGYQQSCQKQIVSALSRYKTLRGACLALQEYIPELGLLENRGERTCRILQR